MNLRINTIASLAIAFIFLFPSCGGNDDGETIYANAPNPPNVNELLQLINNQRSNAQDCKGSLMPEVPQLSSNQILNNIASLHSQFMNEEDKLTSVGSNGSDLSERLSSGGYIAAHALENLIIGAATEEEAIDLWLSSEEQCKNIMDSEVTEIGVGTAGPYWTLILANPQ